MKTLRACSAADMAHLIAVLDPFNATFQRGWRIRWEQNQFSYENYRAL